MCSLNEHALGIILSHYKHRKVRRWNFKIDMRAKTLRNGHHAICKSPALWKLPSVSMCVCSSETDLILRVLWYVYLSVCPWPSLLLDFYAIKPVPQSPLPWKMSEERRLWHSLCHFKKSSCCFFSFGDISKISVLLSRDQERSSSRRTSNGDWAEICAIQYVNWHFQRKFA